MSRRDGPAVLRFAICYCCQLAGAWAVMNWKTFWVAIISSHAWALHCEYVCS